MRGPILDRLVARKLLVHEAERRKLQQTPEYLAAVRRQRDLILSSLLRQDIEASIPGPSATEASDYIDTHPWQFARRFASLVEPVSSARSGLTGRFWQDSFDLTRSDADRLWAMPIGGRATISVRGTTIPVILIAQMPNPVSGIDSRHAASTILRKQGSRPGAWCRSTVAKLPVRALSTSAVADGQFRGWSSANFG
jgi:hypothetical protein